MTQAAHTSAFIDEMKVILAKEEERLTGLISRLGHKGQGGSFDADFPEYGDDEDENAVEVSDYSSNVSLESEMEKELRDVKAALLRIENGTYGIDKYTGEPIDEARLRARPTSTSSIESKKTLKQEI